MAEPLVLVVEDNPITRKMLCLALRAESIAVVEAADGRAALAEAARATPALVLQDLLLPDMDGVELARRLRSIPACADVPVVALSGFLARLEEARTVGAGFTAYLVKPVEPSRLVEIVRGYLPSGRNCSGASGRGRRVLLVDDDTVKLKLMRLHLAADDFQVDAAADGESALRLARAQPPGVVLSDVLMQGMDGFELCLRIRRDPALARVPVLLLSSYFVEDADRALARRAGANDLLTRPADPHALCALAAECAEAGPPPPPADTVEALHGEHALRVVRQLERQVALNAGLAQRCAVQTAEISMLCGVADALARNTDADAALRDVLANCLDAAGISRGALFLADDTGTPVLRHAVGYGGRDLEGLRSFFGHADVLHQAFDGELALVVPSPAVTEAKSQALLAASGLSTLLVVPLVAAGARLGVLFVGSSRTDVTGTDQVAFARTLAAQVGQTVALAMSFARLARAEKRLRVLMESASEGITILSTAGVILESNRAMRQLVGKTEGELRGRRVLDLVDGERRAMVATDLAQMRGDWHSRAGDVRIRRPDGTEVVLDFSASLVDTGDGKVVLSLARDMTERRAVEDALRTSEARFRSLVESMDDVVVTLDAQGRCTGCFGRWMERQGRTEDAYLGRTIREMLGDAVAPTHEAALARAVQGEDVVYEWTKSEASGPREFETSMSPMRDADGTVAGVLAVGRDVTEQRRLQNQLMMSDRMFCVGLLAAGVAHEINNPLAAVVANLDVAARDVAKAAQRVGPTSGLQGAGEALADAREGADRVRQIVRDLKVFSRSEEERRGPVDVNRVAESALRMAWNEIRHRARLVKDLGEVPPVEGNESRLGQVMLNLIVNAAQAMPEGRAESNTLRVATKWEAGRVVVEISDTGAGMAPEVLRNLFSPFFTTKPAGIGTGLGLTICQRIVTSMGGEIRVDSEVGRGSVFRVTLPPAAEQAVAPAQSRPAGGAVAARRGRVLVVDDEPAIGAAVRRLLSSDHDVEYAPGGADALARIGASAAYDLVLCDLMMPEMTGADLHAELLRTAPEQAHRMVFVTGGAFTPAGRAFLDQVPNERFEKPFDGPALRAFVNARVR